MNPGQPCGVCVGGDGNRGKLVLADWDQSSTGGTDSKEPELAFGICTGPDHLGLAGQCHPGSCHGDASYTVHFSKQNVSVTNAAAAVLAGAALRTHLLTLGYGDLCDKHEPGLNKTLKYLYDFYKHTWARSLSTFLNFNRPSSTLNRHGGPHTRPPPNSATSTTGHRAWAPATPQTPLGWSDTNRKVWLNETCDAY